MLSILGATNQSCPQAIIQLSILLQGVQVGRTSDADKGELGSVLDQPRIANTTLEPMDIFGQPIIR